MVHIAKWKENEINEIIEIINNNPVIGIINVSGIPAPQLQKIRQNLGDKAVLKITKNLLFLKALEQANKTKKDINNLNKYIDGQVGIIATDINPFRLFQELEATKTPAPASGGELATEDIIIKEGETSFKPGPIVGELQKAGIPAAIEAGKVVIKSERTLVKEGETIPKEVAPMLTKMGIFPLIVGLDLKGIYENGLIYPRETLDIDIVGLKNDISTAAAQAFNLAFNATIPLAVTIVPLIQKAQSQAINLMFNANILMPETVKNDMQKAHNQMLTLATHVKDGLGDELKDKLGLN